MAGIPNKIVKNAAEKLKQLETLKGSKSNADILIQEDDMQLSFFKLDDPVLEQIRDDINNLEINSLTPVRL